MKRLTTEPTQRPQKGKNKDIGFHNDQIWYQNVDLILNKQLRRFERHNLVHNSDHDALIFTIKDTAIAEEKLRLRIPSNKDEITQFIDR